MQQIPDSQKPNYVNVTVGTEMTDLWLRKCQKQNITDADV